MGIILIFLSMLATGIAIAPTSAPLTSKECRALGIVQLIISFFVFVLSTIVVITSDDLAIQSPEHARQLKEILDENYFVEKRVDDKLVYIEIRDKAGNTHKLEAVPQN